MPGISTLTYLLLNLLTTTSISLVGLLGVWATLGRKPHWFIRCGLLLGVILLGLLIPAHELVAMYFVQSMTVISALFFYRAFGKNANVIRSGLQFSLSDILLFTLLTALVFAAACSTEAGSWTINKTGFFMTTGFIFGLATLVACGVVFSKKWLWRCAWFIILLIALLIAALSHYLKWNTGSNDPFVPAIVSAVIIAWLLLAKYSGFSPIEFASTPGVQSKSIQSQRKLPRRIFRTAWMALSLLILIPTAGTLYFMATPPPFPETILPTPNGYDTFVRVGKELVKITVPDLSMPGSITKQSLAAFKRQSDGLLAQAHEALDQECQCLAFSEETWQQSWLPEIQAIRELARGFAVQGYTAHMNSEDNKAIECYLATVRMGKASSRGGLYIDALVGIACEGIGLNHLHDLQTSLSEEQLLELAQTLCSMQELNEPLEVIAARDEVADYYICGWVGRLQLMLEKISQPDDLFSKKLMGIALQRRQSQYQILLIEIALTRYHNKHGIYPQKLDALVPDFLGELPKEPHGADGFIYRLKETQSNVTNQPPYELYSPGPNLLDDGGNPNTTNNSFDDISFSR